MQHPHIRPALTLRGKLNLQPFQNKTKKWSHFLQFCFQKGFKMQIKEEQSDAAKTKKSLGQESCITSSLYLLLGMNATKIGSFKRLFLLHIAFEAFDSLRPPLSYLCFHNVPKIFQWWQVWSVYMSLSPDANEICLVGGLALSCCNNQVVMHADLLASFWELSFSVHHVCFHAFHTLLPGLPTPECHHSTCSDCSLVGHSLQFYSSALCSMLWFSFFNIAQHAFPEMNVLQTCFFFKVE